MQTNLQHRFTAVADVRTVPDPWGLGVTFRIVRDGAPQLERWRRERIAGNPIARLMAETATRIQFERACHGGSLTAEQEAAIIATGAGSIQFSPDQLVAMNDEVLEDAVERIDGWVGLATPEGEPIPFSREAARELLSTSDVEVGEVEEYGGQSLGAALRAFVVVESKRAEAYRAATIEAAAGN